jgi:NADPH-dependent curcumin reductase CurA
LLGVAREGGQRRFFVSMHAAHVQAGQMVFVHGLSGVVGHALLTLSKLQGAQVFRNRFAEKPCGLD